MSFAAAWATVKQAVTLMSITRRKSSVVRSSRCLRTMIAALLTTTSSRPAAAWACSTAPRASASTVRSATTARASAPASLSSAARASTASFRSTSTSRAPAAAKPRARPEAMPPAPPVISATRPSSEKILAGDRSSNMGSSSVLRGIKPIAENSDLPPSS